MPELPEVETVRAGLAKYLTGARVEGVEVFDARSLKRHLPGSKDFIRQIVGKKFKNISRRGKFLWIPLTGTSQALVGHLGMSGQMLVRKKGEAEDKLTRIVFEMKTTRGKSLEFRFIDQRLFGSLAIDDLVKVEFGEQIPSTVAHIARDPLDPHFDEVKTLDKMRSRTAGIKKVLLDQGVMSGVGNIYADEALWRAKLHYDQPANSLSFQKSRELLGHVREILAAAVEVGGTSFDEQYKNVNGEAGYFEISLNAYGQTGQPCNRCGSPIVRENWQNRGSHFCRKCQKLRVS